MGKQGTCRARVLFISSGEVKVMPFCGKTGKYCSNLLSVYLHCSAISSPESRCPCVLPLVRLSKHGLTGVLPLCSQVSMASLKDLDQRLFESYIELKADPIVGSLEPGIYAGYFDWRDCLPPTGGWFQITGLQVHAS